MNASYSTADLMDLHGETLQSCDIQFRQFGGRARFHGLVRTIRTLEDNTLIKQLLESPGDGCVLVVDGGGSLRTALIGDVIGASAVKNRWTGLIIHGAVRDTDALGLIDLGIKAVGSNPRKSAKHGIGAIDTPVTFGGTTFVPGAWLYSDADGVVVHASRLH